MTKTIDKIGSGEIYLQIMKTICGDVSDKSVIDLMCYHSPYIPQLGFSERTYVDIQDRKLDHKEEQQFFVLSDVFDFLNGNRKVFDFAICTDGIEHLSFKRGIELITLMTEQSQSQILFTPLGENMVNKKATHPDIHKSGWTPDIIDKHFKGYFSYIVMPNFHTTFGAFFFWRHNNLDKTNFVNDILKNLQ